MLDEISGLGAGGPERLSRSSKAKTAQTERTERTDAGPDEEVELDLSAGLRELLDRIKGAQTARKSVVHAVLEKLERGELVTSETVREAAEKVLREGV